MTATPSPTKNTPAHENCGFERGDIDLTRHKISDRWRERAWLLVECGSHRKWERGAASGSLHRLVRWLCRCSLAQRTPARSKWRRIHMCFVKVCARLPRAQDGHAGQPCRLG